MVNKCCVPGCRSNYNSVKKGVGESGAGWTSGYVGPPLIFLL